MTVFTPIKQQRVFVQIVEQIIDLIRRDEFPPGSQLPPERDLAQRLDVSRASLREALSALQILGLVETRSGQGTFVNPGDPSPLLRLTASWLYEDEESPFAILEARKAVEPAIAALAATQRSDTSLEHLREILDLVDADLDDVPLFCEGDRKFHLALAEATENPVLIAMMSILHELMGQRLWVALIRDTTCGTPGRLQSGTHEHRAIYEAVEARDAEAAATRMREHLALVERAAIEGELAPRSIGLNHWVPSA
ncbi:MAG TPA: FadR/GntR family transcriptional regulator [Anaerolineae bacterium]|nr:FadR/GntR family transcriptional regulator [Anaerolineae bacterium]